MSSDILVIPDTQVREGVDTKHIEAAGRYAAWHRPDVIVFIGDFMDTLALSRFNSRKQAEGVTLEGDFIASIAAMKSFLKPIKRVSTYNPRLVIVTGNHEASVRIKRLEEDQPELRGSIEDKFTKLLDKEGFEVIPFLEVIEIEGIRFSHFFSNPSSLKGNPISGAIETCIKNLGHSFCSGHQQGLRMGKRYLSDGGVHLGIVAGSFYTHDEPYMNPQSNHHWRGIVHLSGAEDGDADIAEVSVKTLLNEY